MITKVDTGMQSNKKYPHKYMLNLLLMAALFMLLAGCMPLQPDASGLITPAVQAENNAEPAGSVNLGDVMEMGAAVATITTPSLVLRQSPDEDSDVLQALDEGDVYKVIGISTDGTWVRLEALETPNGSGWVAARFVTVKGDITDVPITDDTGEAISRPTPAPGGVVVRTDGTRLRVRAEPATDSNIVSYIYDGEAYNVLETTSDGSWARLDIAGISDGGWVSTEFLTFPGDAVPEQAAVAAEATEPPAEEAVPEEAVPEESAAEETAPPAPEAENADAEVTPAPEESADITATPVAEEESRDAEATAVPAEESADPTATPVPADESAEDAELPTPNPGEAIVYTDGSRLRVRSQPNAESELVGYVQNGEVYKVLESSEDGLWVKLDIPSIEGGGWVADIYVLTAQ